MPPELVDRDAEQVRFLSLLHYAAAGVAAVIGCFPLLHVAIGALFAFMPQSMRGTGKDAFPREAGFFFMGIGLVFVLAGWSIAAAHFLTARFLKQRRHYWFCVVASAVTTLACMFSSGIIGVASLVVLFRPGIRELFEKAAPSPAGSMP
jgi:hypothetical protein